MFIVDLCRHKSGIDVSSVPVEELVTVVGGDAPSLFRGRDTQLAVEGQVVGHVHFRGIPEKPELKLIASHNNMAMLFLCIQRSTPKCHIPSNSNCHNSILNHLQLGNG